MYSKHTRFGVAGEAVRFGYTKFLSPNNHRKVFYIRAHGKMIEGKRLISDKFVKIPAGVSVTFMNQLGTCGYHKRSLDYLHTSGPLGPSRMRDLQRSSLKTVINAIKTSTGLKEDTYKSGERMIDIRLKFRNIPHPGVYLLQDGVAPLLVLLPSPNSRMMISELIKLLGPADYITSACRNIPINSLPLSSKDTRRLLKSSLSRKSHTIYPVQKPRILRKQKRVSAANKFDLRILRSRQIYTPIVSR